MHSRRKRKLGLMVHTIAFYTGQFFMWFAAAFLWLTTCIGTWLAKSGMSIILILWLSAALAAVVAIYLTFERPAE
jgi:hypothetical protein